jgi:hypothetical protein
VNVGAELARQVRTVVVTGIKHDDGQHRRGRTGRGRRHRAQAAGQKRGFVVGRNDDYRLLESGPQLVHPNGHG